MTKDIAEIGRRELQGPQKRRVGPSRGYPRLPGSAAVSRTTAGAVHLPPRGAGMPRASSPAATARGDARPVVLISSTTGREGVAPAPPPRHFASMFLTLPGRYGRPLGDRWPRAASSSAIARKV